MKKLALFVTGILVVSSTLFAKENMQKPISPSKEIIAEPIVIEEVVITETPVLVPETYLTLRLGGDIAPRYKSASFDHGEHGYDINDKSGDDWGGEVALEFMRQIWPEYGLQLGLGAAYQRHADAKSNSYNDGQLNYEFDVPRYDSIPVYAIAKYVFTDWNGWKPYAKADIGYSFNRKSGDFSFKSNDQKFNSSAKIDDGMYWGAGLGVEYHDWTLDAMYKVNTAKLKVDDHDNGYSSSEKFDYSRVTVSVGYKFDVNGWY
ncbi:MAG: porin family protein [Bacilli bacterium]|uniref:porin family protein n=1 Tax=Cetobacterium sp. TaxID=2071632 RepID=UPI002FC5BAB9